MQYTVFALAAAAATASAQVTYNSTTGVFTCPANNPNGAFCAGDSLTTNIILRCIDGIGHPGNCNDNLDGEPPFGLSYAPCWETSDTSGDAACSKNCVVYGGSGNFNGTFTLPDCTQVATTTISSSTPSSTTSASGSASASASTSATGGSATTTVSVLTSTTVSCNTTSTTPASLPPTSSVVVAPTTPAGNATITTIATKSSSNTPVGPTGTTSAPPSTFTGAAIANSASLGLAVAGLFAAYLI